jgi:carbon starvation protein
MTPLLIALLAGVGFIIAYHTYGRWLGGKIFALSAKTVCPSIRLEDGADYVPTSRSIVFGHHFTSIAGTGPIVGPAIAIMWGWLPALLWVVFGSIFIGAVHDFGALVVSLRNNGQTVGDIAGRVLNRRVRLLFLLILVMSLTIVLAIFGLVIASVFRLYPAAIFPCIVQIPLAIGIGLLIHRKGANILVPSLVVLATMYFSVFFGDRGLLGDFNQTLAGWSSWTWVAVLLIYSYVASVLPVWTLLQPRDYINSLQLISALGLIVLGLVVAAFIGGAPLADGVRPSLEMAAPLINLNPKGAPLIFPFLFITIACGAISGFHCLVSSGTSSKQLMHEPDARFVGYGGMLTEGFLATLVILACGAGLGLGLAADGQTLLGTDAWDNRYGSWGAAGSLGAKVSAFVFGSANFLQALGLSSAASIALMGVLVASFAGTTLDTACRLQRYVVQELAATLGGVGDAETGKVRVRGPLGWLQNKHGATIFAVLIAAALAAIPPAGKAWSLANAGTGGLLLWPLFGATNQLLAGLAFLVIAFYLWRRGRPVWFIILPMIFMMVMPFWAMIWQLFVGSPDNPSWVSQGKVLLSSIGIATILLEVWMIVEAVRMFPKVKGVIEDNALDLEGTSGADPAEA